MSDHQWQGYEPGGDDPSPWGREPTVTPSGGVPHEPPPPVLEGRRQRTQQRPAIVTALVVAAGIAATSFVVAANDDDPAAGSATASDQNEPSEPEDEQVAPVVEEDPEPEPPSTPALLTTAGYTRLVEAIRERSGSATVFEAAVYPGYAVVDLPVDSTTQREESLRWDGEFTGFGGKGTAREERIDLARVDPRLLVRLVRQASRLVENPTIRYVLIRGRSTVFPDDGARVFAYASNDFGETAYVATTRDGTLVRRITP